MKKLIFGLIFGISLASLAQSTSTSTNPNTNNTTVNSYDTSAPLPTFSGNTTRASKLGANDPTFNTPTAVTPTTNCDDPNGVDAGMNCITPSGNDVGTYRFGKKAQTPNTGTSRLGTTQSDSVSSGAAATDRSRTGTSSTNSGTNTGTGSGNSGTMSTGTGSASGTTTTPSSSTKRGPDFKFGQEPTAQVKHSYWEKMNLLAMSKRSTSRPRAGESSSLRDQDDSDSVKSGASAPKRDIKAEPYDKIHNTDKIPDDLDTDDHKTTPSAPSTFIDPSTDLSTQYALAMAKRSKQLDDDLTGHTRSPSGYSDSHSTSGVKSGAINTDARVKDNTSSTYEGDQVTSGRSAIQKKSYDANTQDMKDSHASPSLNPPFKGGNLDDQRNP